MTSLIRKLHWFLHSRAKEAELREEIQFHLSEDAEQHRKDGLPANEAQWAAKRLLGNVTLVQEDTRAVWIPVWLDQIIQDIRLGSRALRKDLGYTATAVLTLALGIGINTAVFTITSTALFKGFPLVSENDRILYISGLGGMSYPDFEDWRDKARSFEELAAVGELPVSLVDNGGLPESYIATRVSSNAFQLVGQRPIIGRDFAHSDETLGAAPVAIFSYGFWERRYGKDPSIIGRTVRINGAPTTVIGVMARGFTFPQKQELWVPLVPTADLHKREERSLWFAFGRVSPGVTLESVRSEIETIGKQLAIAYPLTNQGYLPRVMTFTQHFIGRNATLVYGSMWAAVGFVLLIACANVANLQIARALVKSREISLRMALGAGRGRIIRQLLMESVMLSCLGGIFGWGLARLGLYAYELVVSPPSFFDHVLDYTMDVRVLDYLIAISIATALLFGLAPALRFSKFDIGATLKDGGRNATTGRRGKNLASFLVIGEMALAFVLLAGAGVMIRSFLNVSKADLGIRPVNVLTMLLKLPNAKYASLQAQTSFFDRLVTHLETIPGVESIAIADSIPSYSTRRFPFELDAAPSFGDGERNELLRPKIPLLVISPSYFKTLGAAVLSGREFNDTDRVSGIPVVIVNEKFASKFWPGEDPLGKRLRLFDGKTPERWRTVVGIASNIVQYGRTQPKLDTLIYVPFRQRTAAFMNVFARTRVPPGGLGTAIRREVQAIDSDLPVSYYMSLAERLSWTYAFNGSIAVLFLIFAVTALLLASIGLYAVIAHSVSRRTQEIGVRVAVGGTAREILKLVFRQGMRQVAIGLGIGLPASFAVNRILRSQLIQVSPADPTALVIASAALILSATLGCLVPACRAMQVDPVVALRHD